MSRRSSVRRMRQAISPRFATRTLSNTIIPDEHLEGRWVVGVAWIVELRTIRDEHDDVHGGLHLHILAGAAQTIGEGEAAVGGDGHIHEEIDVVGEIALADTERLVLRQRQEIAVAAGVHGSLFQIIAHAIGFGRAGPAQRIVPPHRVGDDFGQHIARGRQQLRAAAQVNIALLANGIHRAVAIGNILRVEEQGVGGLIALEIDDPQPLSAAQGVDPILAGPDEVSKHGLARMEFAGPFHGIHAPSERPHRRYKSVFAKPRTFSDREYLQKSSAATGGALPSPILTGLLGYSTAVFKGCGQVCSSTSVSISKRRSTAAPALAFAGSKTSVPSSATDTLLTTSTWSARCRSPTT